MSNLTPKEAADILEKKYNIQGPAKVVINELNARAVAVNYLRKIASGEYKPVVHAHWIETKIFNPKTGNIDNGYKCSKCGLLVGTNKLKYCAKCGAITDEEEDNHGQAN